jgi:predicted PurR-regulated permease PerM
MMYFFLYFMLQQRTRMEAAIVLYLPFKREKINMFGKELVAQTFSNAVGIPLIAAVQGVCAFISYTIVGVGQPGFWGVITAVTSLIPVVGSAIVWIPMSACLFATGANWQGFFLLGWSAIFVVSLDYALRLLLAKRMADVHPVITVLGVIIGIKSFGFIGLIFGPVLISYFLILLKIYYLEYQKNPPPGKPAPVKKRPPVPPHIQPFLNAKNKKSKTTEKTG